MPTVPTVPTFFQPCGGGVLRKTENNQIQADFFAALDDLTTSLQTTFKALGRVIKALMALWLQLRFAELEAKQQAISCGYNKRKLSTEELAKEFNVTPGTVRDWVRKGLPKEPGGRKHVFQLETVERWLSDNAETILKKPQV